MLDILVKPFEYVIFGFIAFYFVFTIMVWRQVYLVTNSVRTGLKQLGLLIALVHTFLGFLALVAAVAIVF